MQFELIGGNAIDISKVTFVESVFVKSDDLRGHGWAVRYNFDNGSTHLIRMYIPDSGLDDDDYRDLAKSHIEWFLECAADLS